MKKLFQGIVVSLLVAVIPVLGNSEILKYPQLWILFILGILASVLQPGYNPLKRVPGNLDKGTVNQIIWSIYITQLAAILEAAYIRYPQSVEWDFLSIAMLPVIIIGLALRTWAVYTLGKYFTMELAIQQGQRVIRTGPYAFCRHPSYAGAFLTYIGTTVFLHAWYSLLLALLLLPAAWLRRIYYEEDLLQMQFGDEYVAYSKTVKRVVPGLW